MKILFVSAELIGSALVHRLVTEGNEVKLFIAHQDRKDCFEGMVEKVNDWRSQLDWVGKNGLIIFDDVIFKGAQDELIQQGYRVVGGNSESDRLENDRQFFQDVLKHHGIETLPSFDFETSDEAIAFIQKQRGKWVVKQTSHLSTLNYVGQRDDGEDVLEVLQHFKREGISPVHLQKRAFGVEVGIARYFNGLDWVGPIEVNFEHKALCNDDLGPLTAEMGTLMWYEDDENFPLYVKTLAKLKPYLQKIQYKGDIDINLIVDGDHAWPLEATTRFGTPSTELQCELHISPWSEFLGAIADGTDYDLAYHRGYGIVVSVAVPPFPYAPENFDNTQLVNSLGESVSFTEELSQTERRKIHFEEVSKEDVHGQEKLCLAGKHGFALYVTGHGDTVESAQKEAYGLVKKIVIPNMFYRTDIGNKFLREDQALLKEWGWIN